MLLDATNGHPRAILDGSELTLRRTGDASALASRHLSSGEILGAIARGIIDQTAVRGEFSDLAAGLFKRSKPHAITIFKSVGTALEDLVAAELSLGANPNRAQRESAVLGKT